MAQRSRALLQAVLLQSCRSVRQWAAGCGAADGSSAAATALRCLSAASPADSGSAAGLPPASGWFAGRSTSTLLHVADRELPADCSNSRHADLSGKQNAAAVGEFQQGGCRYALLAKACSHAVAGLQAGPPTDILHQRRRYASGGGNSGSSGGSDYSTSSPTQAGAQHVPLTQPRSGAAPAADESAPAEASSSNVHASASASATWLERCCPQGLLPYAQLIRLDKPIGTWLLAWPCFWSIALAAPPGSAPDATLLALFGTGALLLRGAGCTVNDLWDADLDKKVARTASRPLAAGTITKPAALGFLAAQLLAGLAILLQLNAYSIVLGASALALVFTYPLMKRVTYWPQAYLGLTFNWGALLGWAAVHGACDWAAVLPLYAAGVCWTLVYDTIYAHQDKADDVHAGVKSTALLFGNATKPWLATFGAGTIGLLGFAGWTTGCGAPFYLGLAAAGSQLAWQVATVDLDSRADCLAKFNSNKWFGAAVFAGIAAARVAA